MARFNYTASDDQGEESQGVIDASSSADAHDRLLAKGLYPLSILESASKEQGFSLFKSKTDPKVVELFFKKLSVITKAGIPILEGIDTLAETSEDPSFTKIIRQIKLDLLEGNELSACLAKHPTVFDGLAVAMVRAGEGSGALDDSLTTLAAQLKFKREISAKVKGATRYPMIVIGVTLAAIGIVNWFVIPAFAKAFAQFKADLPIITRGLLATSSFLKSIGWMIPPAAIAGWATFKRAVSTPSGRRTWHKILLRMPLMGKLMYKTAISRFSSALAGAYRSGVPLNQAIDMVADTSGNDFIADKILGIGKSLSAGMGIHKAAEEAGIFDKLSLSMIRIGDESGRLDELLGEVADLYKTEVEQEIAALSQKIEPILMFILGGMVLVLALGIFLPLWDLGSKALKK